MTVSGKSIAIVDYGMGNIGSVGNALDLLGGNHSIASTAEALKFADAYVLPGVGAFGAAMGNLRGRGLADELTRQVMDRGKPFLGICLGMQILALDSVEQGFHKGLGWLDGHVLALEPEGGLPVPHVGWNDLEQGQDSPLFRGIDQGAHFYFDHGYHLACGPELVSSHCLYGGRCVASVQMGNVMAVQFHPEKSQRNGLKMLRNFLNFVEGI